MDSVAIVHPAATAAAPEGKASRYLVRGDGVVLPYHPALARLGTFEAAEELPPEHVRRIEAARARDAELARLRAEHQQRVRDETQRRELERQVQRDGARGVETVSPDRGQASTRQEADVRLIERARSKAALLPLLERAGVKVNPRLPLAKLRTLALEALQAGAA